MKVLILKKIIDFQILFLLFSLNDYYRQNIILIIIDTKYDIIMINISIKC
jgi:hypothetical protein